MSTNARDRPIIHAPPDLDLAAMVRVDASLSELTDDEIAAVTIFDTEHQLVSTNARDDQIKAVLLDAATWIETHGWCQGRVRDGDRCCVVGAIDRASTASDYDYEDAAYKAVLRQVGLESDDLLAPWNDAPERTQAEVVAALRGAAEGLGKERGE